MKPIRDIKKQENLFKTSLINMIDSKHELVLLANKIDWDYFHNKFDYLFSDKPGKIPKTTRLIVGLLILKNTYNLSDEKLIKSLHENLYFQFFCGYHHYNYKQFIARTTLSMWRSKLGKTNLEIIFKKILELTEELGIKKKDVQEVIIDTTVMEKNIKYPLDAESIEKCRTLLLSQCIKAGLMLRDGDKKRAKRALHNSLRYGRGNKGDLLKDSIAEQKQYLKKVLIKSETGESIQSKMISKTMQETARRLLNQEKMSKNKVYSVHEPHIYCVSKGKKRRRFEFGCKLSLVVDLYSGVVLSSTTLRKNLYDGDSLEPSIAQAEQNMGISIKDIYADKGYMQSNNGVKSKGQNLYISGLKQKGKQKKKMKRRSLIEARISEIKRCGGGSINYLRGIKGDEKNGIMCGVGQNVRIILRHLKSKKKKFKSAS